MLDSDDVEMRELGALLAERHYKLRTAGGIDLTQDISLSTRVSLYKQKLAVEAYRLGEKEAQKWWKLFKKKQK